MINHKHYPNIKYQISHDSKLLFVGTNPSPGTYRREVPFSNNKSFWYLLHAAGLLPVSRHELQDDKLLKKIFIQKLTSVYHLGLINLVYRPTKTISEVKRAEAVPGNLRIISAIKYYRPSVVCFVGKGTYQLFTQTSHCEYGWQAPIDASKIFVMHSPIHGLASIRIEELKEVAKAAKLLKKTKK
jgi:TDG/mug DNA glycosylase family protein